MNITLNAAEARVLGALIEKDITTPDYYPLSLNALVNACNQKNNREPVTNYDEETVRLALRNLSDKRLAGTASGADSRVAKYEHRAQEVFNFTRPETAIMCVLLLRGPQTPGELRSRTERMHKFEHLDDVLSGLQQLMRREPPLAKALGRRPGTKEIRYAHLLSGDVESWEPPADSSLASAVSVEAERIIQLEEQVAALQKEVAELKQQMAEFKRQFE
ncbi:MAG TPA: YceH family protein [Candidatus Acidoferrales bacterium]|nr:YceH family protein [Candidatus Acidoferrales bacterium]